MKRVSLLFVLFAGIGLMAFSPGEETKFTVDAKESSIKWTGKKAAYGHSGTLTIQEGYLTYMGRSLTGGRIVVDMTSITTTDEGMGEKGNQLAGHLKSPDFFDVENHPTATFEITQVNALNPPIDGNNYRIKGNMTIRGKTNEIEFNALADRTESEGVASATLGLDRLVYGIMFAAESEGAPADQAIDDNLGVEVKLVAR